jgi:hypothetical protein
MQQLENRRMARRIFGIFIAHDHLPASPAWQAGEEMKIELSAGVFQ